MISSEFRPPTDAERGLFNRLMEADFPGRDELKPALERIEVRVIDEMGSLEIRSDPNGRARVVKRIPVEAEAVDEDGRVIHILLHVIEGLPVELEIFKEDGSTVHRMPASSAFELIVLPPAPNP